MAQGQARIVWRHMAFLGPESVTAAEASECAVEQGQFWKYHEALFAKQSGRDRGTFSKTNLKAIAAELELQTAQFNDCLDSGKYITQVMAETEEGRRKGVQAVPTLFVNDQKIQGVPAFAQLRQAVEAAAGARPAQSR